MYYEGDSIRLAFAGVWIQSSPSIHRAKYIGSRASVKCVPRLALKQKGSILIGNMKLSLGAKTLVYPVPVFVVGTYGPTGKPNVLSASWGGICCSEPPEVAVSLRKATSSYGNIIARKAFTISIPSEAFVKQADYFGLVSGRNTDKFAASKLTPVRSKLVDAPYVKEFPLVIECKLAQVVELGLHTQFVGEILDVKAEENLIGSTGAIDIKKLKPLVFVPDSQDYYGIGEFVAKVFSAGKEI
jgi:flavin reductase (DIM6/NTAB) family NADH-FMN oxidoreductase RutF